MKKYSVTYAQRQGPRISQEDRGFCKRIERYEPIVSQGFCGWLLAVMDGHGGPSVAELCANEIGDLFMLQDADHTEEALLNLVAVLNAKTAHSHEGSTLSVACVIEDCDKVSIAVLGDSPVIVLDGKGKLHVSPEHNTRSNGVEREAAEKRGGVCKDGYLYKKDGDRGLQLSRALGDAYLEGVISREPEIYTLESPQWILIASDGLLDPAHYESPMPIKEIERLAERHASAKEVMQWATYRELRDNATALVWG